MTLAGDVAAAVEQLRRERSIGASEAVNDLIRAGLLADRPTRAFAQTTHGLGQGIDYADIQEALETLDGPRTP